MCNHDDLEFHRNSLKMMKIRKIAGVSMEHSRVVVRPRPELASATLLLARLHLREVLSKGSINEECTVSFL